MTIRFVPVEDHKIDPGLAQYATPTQLRYLQAVAEHGSGSKAAAALGVCKNAVNESIARLKAKAAAQGWAPEYDLSHRVPEPFVAKGHSTLYGADGEVKLQWVKTRIDDDRRAEMLRAAIEEACKAVPALPPVKAPTHTVADLLNFYVFTDYHLGMRAWSEEGGAQWNLEIAEDLIIRAFAYMLDNTPAAEVGFIAQLGDFAHFDSLRPVTPTSGHIVDASSHYAEIVRAIIRIMRRMVEMALAKHNRVVLLMAEGNHDIASSVWMREVAKSWYVNEPRVEVIDSAHPFYAFEWGVTMLGIHHGHCARKFDMAKIFANFYAEMWGRTKKRYGKRGHHHHEVEISEDGGMKNQMYPTLAPSDSHSARNAYMSARQTNADTYSRRFGKVSEIIVTPEMLCSTPVLEAA